MLVRNKTLFYAFFALSAALMAWFAYDWRTGTDPEEGWIPVNDLLQKQMPAPGNLDPAFPADGGGKGAQSPPEYPQFSARENAAPPQTSGPGASIVAGLEKPRNEKININTATPEQLAELPGIGPSKARAIVEYRESVGGFRTVEELIKVKGIGEKTFQRLKDLVTVK